ncbi:MAG: UDP-glucose 4-epimerase [Arenicella sp.]|jgi:UDP-glucose 4-epimerase
MYLHWSKKTDDPKSSLVTMVFGVGLIGNAIIAAMRNGRSEIEFNSKEVHFPWSDIAQQTQILESLEEDMTDLFSAAANVEVVWSAGKAGFASNQAEVDAELVNYRTVLHWLDRLQKNRGLNIRVNLISTLGGIFEQELLVSSESVPKPLRAYGHLKLLQENELIHKDNLDRRIYRVSSAYGYVSSNKRMGLIPTLIANGISEKHTLLSGSLDTLRDYIWVEDLAAYIVTNLYCDECFDDVLSVASFRSHSIQQLIEKIELLLNQKLLLRHDRRPTNARSISISASLRPPGLVVSDINQTLADIVKTCEF